MEKEQNRRTESREGTSAGEGIWDVSVSTSLPETSSVSDSGNTAGPGDPFPIDVPPMDGGNAYGANQKYPVWVNVLAIIGVFIGVSFVGNIVRIIIERSADADPAFATFVSYVVSVGITVVFAWWITTRKGTVRHPFSFSLKRSNPTLILWGIILVLVTSTVIEPLLELFPAEYLDYLQDAVGTGGWAMLTTVVAAPLLEEILFRGIIQQEISNSYGKVRGVVMAAAVFGIVHIIPQQVINAFFIGIILGYIYIKSGSLTPAILIHAVNNAISYIFMQLFGDKFTFTRDLFGNQGWYWVLYGLCCLIFIVAGWKLIRELGRLPSGSDGTGAVKE